METVVMASVPSRSLSGRGVHLPVVFPRNRRRALLLSFDDAMISMRYAWNLSHGLGLIWNVGERVAGYSNLLMTLLHGNSYCILDKSHAVLSVQIAGVGFMLGVRI